MNNRRTALFIAGIIQRLLVAMKCHLIEHYYLFIDFIVGKPYKLFNRMELILTFLVTSKNKASFDRFISADGQRVISRSQSKRIEN